MRVWVKEHADTVVLLAIWALVWLAVGIALSF